MTDLDTAIAALADPKFITAAERGRAAGHNAAVARLMDPKLNNRMHATAAAQQANDESEVLYPGDRNQEGGCYSLAYYIALTDALTAAENGETVLGYNDQLADHKYPCNQNRRPGAACLQPWICGRTD